MLERRSAWPWIPAFAGMTGSGRVNKAELIAAAAQTADLPRARAAELVDAVFGAIGAALGRREDVRLQGFGTFTRSERGAATGVNPRSGETLEIAPSVSGRFRAGKVLRDALR